MRVCTAKQMAAIDRAAIDGGVPASELMERAGRALADHVLEFVAEHADSGHGHDHGHDHDHDHDHGHDHACGDSACEGHEGGCDEAGGATVLVVCGKGNNGGDGLVVARLVHEEGLAAIVLLLAGPKELSREALKNLERLPDGVEVVAPPPEAWVEAYDELSGEATVVVDAVLGTGKQGALGRELAALFRAMNDAAVPTLAVDVPSGVNGDDGTVDPVAVAADVTVTIGLPKLGLLLPPGRDYAGRLEVVDIGFDPAVCAKLAGPWHWLQRQEYLGLLPPRPTSVHKGQCGSLVVLAGSRSYGGAAHLAALGGLRSGAGLVTVAAPVGLETALRVALPEALVRPLAETAAGTLAPPEARDVDALLAGADALVIGPGLGDDPATDAWVRDLLLRSTLPMVVDADGLNALARGGVAPAFGGRQVVLTPHPGEFARLAGLPVAEVAARRLELAAWAAETWGAVVVLKGSPAFIGVPGEGAFVNATGDDALARGGSGDVLAGLIAGLLAQGLPARDAALLGCYVHGLAGTAAAREMSSRGVLVREVAAAIGPQWLALEREASGVAELRERLWPSLPPEGAR
ncbi:MAG: NAD(P)H-hydrate dehydratase [bacterium]|nr:NAD(P)H-hydrate dehydratase [bacterium]